MRSIKTHFKLSLLFLLLLSLAYTQDWAKLDYYKQANIELGPATKGDHRVVFMGNSITQEWLKINPDFFAGKDFINRGISGQTSPQMLVRFRSDCVYLKPDVVIISAGTNDIAENTGPIALEQILANIISMVELAEANGITCILTSLLPAESFSWRPELKPALKILEINQLIKSYARKRGLLYIDYYSSMVNRRGGLKQRFTRDGVHPNKTGYLEMEKFARPAIMKALQVVDNQEHSMP
jgi:lysophospholipase L1-like esterase